MRTTFNRLEVEMSKKSLQSISILKLSSKDASKFFLKEESYCSIELPPYFVFDPILESVARKMKGKTYIELNLGDPTETENVNYKLLGNKDGKFSWRPFEIVNPILYTSLVNAITSEESWKILKSNFKKYQKDPKILCKSIPVESKDKYKDKAIQIRNWWEEIEQESISLALDFEYLIHADISNCYPSIYTHTIPWALHTKQIAKKYRFAKPSLLGNIIDSHLQAMNCGQTNGIPQGSVLMDFLAEILLGAVDQALSVQLKKEKISKFKILRYRDDYRIFAHNHTEGMFILKILSEILSEFSLKLNALKTVSSSNVIRDSVKPDKLYFLLHYTNRLSISKHLFLIHNLSDKFPDSGSLIKALTLFYRKIEKVNLQKHNLNVLTSMLVDIMFGNPKVIPHAIAILSLILSSYTKHSEKTKIIKKIKNKFKSIPNTGLLQVWLQRLSKSLSDEITYEEKLCVIVDKKEIKIWNNDWIKNNKFKKCYNDDDIISKEILDSQSPKIEISEIDLFNY